MPDRKPRTRKPRPVIADAFDSIRGLMATDARDWAATSRDAWTWGVLIGWPPAALHDVARKHGWSADSVARLKLYRAAVAAAERGE
jgi:hypothetical protein